MLEYPEGVVVASQLCEAVQGRKVVSAVAGSSPHKFAWYHGDRAGYGALLSGRVLGQSTSFGSYVEIEAEDARIAFGDGVSPRFHGPDEPRPAKHQLLIELDDGSALSGSVQMYGGLFAFRAGEYDNPYYRAAREAPPILSEKFDDRYFGGLIAAPQEQKLSAKGFLATEQRIPGLGNGVLQDILFAAGINPKRKVQELGNEEKLELFQAIKSVLAQMVECGGRDTEKDLRGHAGGYRTQMSRNTLGSGCPKCGETIVKESYLGGAVYFCPGCQRL